MRKFRFGLSKTIFEKVDWKQIKIFSFVLILIFFVEWGIIRIPLSDINFLGIIFPAIGFLLTCKYFLDVLSNKLYSNKKRSLLHDLLSFIFGSLTLVSCFVIFAASVIIMILSSLPEQSTEVNKILLRATNLYLWSMIYVTIYYFVFWIRRCVDSGVVVKINNEILRPDEKFIIWPFVKYDVEIFLQANKLPDVSIKKNMEKEGKICLNLCSNKMELPLIDLKDNQIRKMDFGKIRQESFQRLDRHAQHLILKDNFMDLKKEAKKSFQIFIDGIPVTIKTGKVKIEIL